MRRQIPGLSRRPRFRRRPSMPPKLLELNPATAADFRRACPASLKRLQVPLNRIVLAMSVHKCSNLESTMRTGGSFQMPSSASSEPPNWATRWR